MDSDKSEPPDSKKSGAAKTLNDLNSTKSNSEDYQANVVYTNGDPSKPIDGTVEGLEKTVEELGGITQSLIKESGSEACYFTEKCAEYNEIHRSGNGENIGLDANCLSAGVAKSFHCDHLPNVIGIEEHKKYLENPSEYITELKKSQEVQESILA
tara:strand:- start:322 stop:786 length:465 start_codon:yes stop_codon:yes gene_type:complete